MENKHTPDYQTGPSEFTSRIYFYLLYLWTPKGLISPEYFFSQTCVSLHGCKKVSNSWC